MLRSLLSPTGGVNLSRYSITQCSIESRLPHGIRAEGGREVEELLETAVRQQDGSEGRDRVAVQHLHCRVQRVVVYDLVVHDGHGQGALVRTASR
eukprot:1208300-Rhodomonas_salina.2